MGKIDYQAIGLKTQYTFEELVIGPGNQIPAKACLEVVKNPGEAYNPLLIYGEPGLGKTHLVQAVAHAMLKANSKLKVKYISAERFANDVIQAISNDDVMALRDRYSKLDLLIMGDIQYLIESKATQAEFLHIFNNLHQDNHQIIMTADRSPNKLTGLDKNLRTRFEWGLVTDIKVPDARTRLNILTSKQKKWGLEIDQEILRYAAGMLRSDVRGMEGFLKKVNAYVSLSPQEVDMDFIKRVLGEVLPEGQADLPPEEIKDEEPAPPPKPKAKAKAKTKPAPAPEPPPPPPPPPKQPSAPVVEKQPLQPPSNPFPQPATASGSAQPAPSAEPKKASPPKPLEVVLPNDAPAPPPVKPPLEPPKAPEKGERVLVPPADALVTPGSPAETNGSSNGATPPTVNEKEKPKSQEIEIPDFEEEDDPAAAGLKEIGAVFFYPNGEDAALKSVHQKFQEVIKKHKLKFRLKKIGAEGYEIKNKVNYSSFVDVCKKNKVPVAIVIGPPPTAVLPEQDFYDLLSVTLDVQGISLQLINWGEIEKDYKYLNLALDIALVRSR